MRVLHAPIDIAGQLSTLSAALREQGIDSTALVLAAHRFDYGYDVNLHLDQERSSWRRRWRVLRTALSSVSRYDVFHFHGGSSLLPRNADIPFLKAMGKKIVFHFWGSDVRLRSKALDPAMAKLNEESIVAKLSFLGRFANLALVADAELMQYVSPYFSRVEYLPHAVKVKGNIGSGLRQRLMPLVVHAPSDRTLKGTNALLEAVERLKQEGVSFQFNLLEGLRNHDLMHQVADADIVVDQLRLGTHGVFSVEAMALGKPVICYIAPQFRSGYPADLPVISASVHNVVDQLRLLVNMPIEQREELGRAGVEYAFNRHDTAVVATALIRLYRTL